MHIAASLGAAEAVLTPFALVVVIVLVFGDNVDVIKRDGGRLPSIRRSSRAGGGVGGHS